jgi:hypothetical protein
MTTAKSTRRSDNIIPVVGAKGTAYKVLLRFKGKGTICKTFPTMKEARAFRDKVKGSKDLQSQLGGSGGRMMLSEAIDKYMLAYKGRDKSVPQKCALWKERLGNWKLTEITRQTVAEELDKLKSEPALQPLRNKTSRDATRTRSEATVNRSPP